MNSRNNVTQSEENVVPTPFYGWNSSAYIQNQSQPELEHSTFMHYPESTNWDR